MFSNLIHYVGSEYVKEDYRVLFVFSGNPFAMNVSRQLASDVL